MRTDPSNDITKQIIRSLNLSSVLAALIDNRGNIVWINQRMIERLGKSSEALLNQHFAILLDPNLGDLAEDVLITSINEGSFQSELLMAAHDQTFPAFVTASYIPLEDETDFCFLFIAIDRTSEKVLEEEARKRREFLYTIIRRSPLGIFCLDTDGKFTIINDAMSELIEKANLEIRQNQHFESSTDKLNPSVVELIQKGLKGESFEISDIPLLSKEQSKPVVSVMSSPIRSPAGKLEGLAVLIEDRTEKIRLAEKMQEADRLSSIGILAAGVAHDVNNPLSGLMGVIGSMKKGAIEKGIDPEYFERIQTGLDRISNIVQSLNILSRKKIGEITELDINALIEKTVEFFRMQPKFEDHQIIISPADDIPHIRGDTVHLEQVLQNLIINAADANGEEGTISIETSHDKTADEVIIRIIDTGCGIESENLDKVFEAFFTTKEPGKGTGLGLAVSRSLILQHGGSIYIEKTGAEGTTFAIRLPVDSSQLKQR